MIYEIIKDGMVIGKVYMHTQNVFTVQLENDYQWVDIRSDDIRLNFIEEVKNGRKSKSA